MPILLAFCLGNQGDENWWVETTSFLQQSIV